VEKTDHITFPTRPTGPSETQLELVRNVVYSFYCFKFFGKKAPYSDKVPPHHHFHPPPARFP
jgi:hypothetical protein